tara:strand:+ start:332 stop:1006 length:675 start_codon:yes stop_codon:yes gene_type:complete
MTRQRNPHQTDPSKNPDRIGAITASPSGGLHAAIQKNSKGGYNQRSRESLIDTKVSEQLTGWQEEVYISKAMQNGIDREADCKEAFEEATGRAILDVSFTLHKKIGYFGASPDGVFEDNPGELIEIKCPLQKTYARFLRTLEIPAEYQTQMIAQVACMQHIPNKAQGAKSVLFIMYHPRFYPSFVAVPFKVTVKQIKELESEVTILVSEIIEARLQAESNQWQE